MTVYARYDGPRVCDYITPGKLYEVTESDNRGFSWIDGDGDLQAAVWNGSAHLNGGNWTRVEIPEGRYVPGVMERRSDTPRKWFVVPDYKPDATPATSATVVDRAGQQVAHFERIADAEIAVEAVNGRE